MADTSITERADFDFNDVKKIDQGINRDDRQDIFPPEFLYDALNVRAVKDSVELDTGYGHLGSALWGIPQRQPRFVSKDSSVVTLCITTKTIYKWVSSVAEWQYLDHGTATTTDTTHSAGETSISVVSESGFSGGDRVGVDLDDGSQHQTTVASTSAGTIVIDDAVPTGRSVASGAAVKKPLELNGSISERVDVATWAAADFMFFTNNSDRPKYYDHANGNVSDVQNLPGSTFLAKTVDVYFQHVIFGYTTEDGTAYPQRIRWCDTGDPTEWSAGNASWEDLWDTEGEIRDLERLGNFMFVYKSDAYIEIEHVGTEDRLFNTETKIFGKGVLGVDCAVTIDEVHLLFDRHEISIYDGGVASRPVSMRVEELFAGVDGNFDNNKGHLAFAVYIEEVREAFFFYPSVDAENGCDSMLRFNVVDQTWFRRSLTDEVVSWGRHKRVGGLRWSDLVGSWEQQLWRWNSQAARGNVTGLTLGGFDDQIVYFYDFTSNTDDGATLSYLVETGDFDLQKGQIRTDAIRALLKGHDIGVYISLDQGATWELLETVSPGGSYKKVRVDHQRVGWTIRYKFEGSGADFGVRWITLKMREETEY